MEIDLIRVSEGRTGLGEARSRGWAGFLLAFGSGAAAPCVMPLELEVLLLQFVLAVC